jgi:aldehyde dehydrogenase (NAD+)
MYGNEENGSPDMGKIITDWHCDRIKGLIESSKGKVVCGGKVNRSIKYVEPTIILNPEDNSPVMQEEIFGPVIPIITFKDIDQVINIINSKDKPLAIYYYGKCYSNPNNDRLLNETSSGAYVVNEAIIQICNHEFGFGGVGASGYGRYGGYDGFKQWSNPKSVMIKPTMNVWPYNQLGPPFTPQK